MEEARTLLRNCHGDVDIIIARDPSPACHVSSNVPAAPVERRKRRRLPLIERPRSAPIYDENIDFQRLSCLSSSPRSLVYSPGPESSYRVSQDNDAGYRVSQTNGGLKTVIHISETPCSVPSTPTLQHYSHQQNNRDTIKGKISVW